MRMDANIWPSLEKMEVSTPAATITMASSGSVALVM